MFVHLIKAQPEGQENVRNKRHKKRETNSGQARNTNCVWKTLFF